MDARNLPWLEIAKRSPDYIKLKMEQDKAVIALTAEGQWVGFCYIESWEHEKFVANSGLIVAPEFRKSGVATEIKRKVFALSRKKYPDAKIFGLTTGLAVMKINSDLGYEPVTYNQLTTDEQFWKGCQSCVNYEILKSKERKNCMCTAMLFDPAEKQKEYEDKMKKITHKATLLERIENAIKKRMDKFVAGERIKVKGERLSCLPIGRSDSRIKN